MPDIFRL